MADDDKFEEAKKKLKEKLERNRKAAEEKEAQPKKIMKSRIQPVGKKKPKPNGK